VDGKRLSRRAGGVSLVEVARSAGVSPATASRVLAKSGYGVSDGLRERVLAVARSLDYVPNASAQSLHTGLRAIVGILVHDMLDSSFAEFIRAAEEVADLAGWLTIIVNARRDVEKEMRHLRTFRSERLGAVVLVGSAQDDDAYRERLLHELQAHVRSGVRVVLTARHGLPFLTITTDNESGAYQLVRLLIQSGHRRIGVVAGPEGITATRDRLAGAERALREGGVQLRRDLIVYGDFRRDSGVAGLCTLLERDPQLTAVFAMNDEAAFGVYDEARSRGLLIPRDLSVVGYNDVAFSRDVTPPLTTVRYPFDELARRAIEACVADEPLSTDEVVLKAELRARGSISEPKARLAGSTTAP